MAGCIAAGISRNVSLASQRGLDNDHWPHVHADHTAGLVELLVTRRGSLNAYRYPMGKLVRNRDIWSQRHVHKKQGLRALCEACYRFALAHRLQTRSHCCGIERLERLPVADHLNLLYGNVGTRSVRQPQLVDQVNSSIRPVKRHRRILNSHEHGYQFSEAPSRDAKPSTASAASPNISRAAKRRLCGGMCRVSPLALMPIQDFRLGSLSAQNLYTRSPPLLNFCHL